MRATVPSVLETTLQTFFLRTAPTRPDERVLVAFSGGPDSTALLLGLRRLAERPGPLAELSLTAAHLDHAMDPGSGDRAARAEEMARRLGVPMISERRPIAEHARARESLEAAGRRVRYDFLEAARRAAGARWIATAHHLDDQAETVLLRLLGGSGLEGLAAIRPVRGTVVRPLLGLARSDLAAAVAAAGMTPIEDPTNRDRSIARNRVRHDLLPALAVQSLGAARLAALAAAAAGARDRLERTLENRLTPASPDEGSEAPAAGRPGVAVPFEALEALPAPLLPHALAFLHRRAGAPFPAGAAARGELARQLSARRATGAASGPTVRVGCDAGDGWRWQERGAALELLPPAVAAGPAGDVAVSYTLEAPGEVRIPELGVTFSIRRAPVAPWMFEGAPHRAALALPLGAGTSGECAVRSPGDRLEVRTRRPGDRIRPLGAPGERKLKDVLIDRRVPRDQRDRLPLLCFGDRIAWVPGVTVDEAFRISPGAETAWIAEVAP